MDRLMEKIEVLTKRRQDCQHSLFPLNTFSLSDGAHLLCPRSCASVPDRVHLTFLSFYPYGASNMDQA